jgi:hypothetical protein
VNLFKKNKKKPITLNDVTHRIRGFVLDSQIDNGHELSVILGCPPISDDVQEREEQESDLRLEKISYMIPIIFTHAHLLAEGAVEFQKMNLPEDVPIPEEIWSESRKMMEQVSLSVLMGSMSQLVDMGLIAIPRKYK